MLNRIDIMGRITRDLDLRTTPSGVSVLSFTLACERDFKNSNGERETDFIDCVAYRNTAEFISRFFKKGNMMAASGRLQIRNWEDKDGNKRRNAEIVIENAYFGESKSSTAPAGSDVELEELDEDDGLLPF